MNVGSIGQSIINGTYGEESRPLTAYEELKAWCEKYLDPDDYKVVPESDTFYTSIYLDIENDDLKYFGFDSKGQYIVMSTCTVEDMIEHIQDLESAPSDN